jgi:hypothetical protein
VLGFPTQLGAHPALSKPFPNSSQSDAAAQEGQAKVAICGWAVFCPARQVNRRAWGTPITKDADLCPPSLASCTVNTLLGPTQSRIPSAFRALLVPGATFLSPPPVCPQKSFSGPVLLSLGSLETPFSHSS